MKRIPYILAVPAITALLFSFQNCGEGYVLDEAQLGAYEIANEAPFAFEVKVDTLSYMSCRRGLGSYSNNINDKNVFYTFKLGAYSSNAGIRLNQDFIDFSDKHFDPPYGSNVPPGQATPTQMQEVLKRSPANRNAQLQLAVRTLTAPRVELITSQGGIISQGNDYANIAGILTGDALGVELSAAERGQWINYFQSGSGYTNRNLAGSLYFTNTSEDDFYPNIMNNGILALTYTMDLEEMKGNNVEVVARGPSDTDMGRAYGPGLQLSFTRGDIREPKAKPRVLSTVREFDLETKSEVIGAGWECPPSLRYTIVHPDHEDEACPAEEYDKLTASEKESREIAKRHLGGENWRINAKEKCAVPRNGVCYGFSSARGVNYARTTGPREDCNDDPTSAAPVCAHYVSFCVRKGL